MLSDNTNPLVNRTLSDQVADSLRKLILSGEIAPGEQLIEAEIAKHFNISRNPVREALRKLEKSGLVIGKAYKGFSVVKLSSSDIRDLYEVRLALEKVAIERIIKSNDPTILQKLRESVNAIKQATKNGDLWEIVDKELLFHDRMCELSGNKQLLETYRMISPRIRLVLAFDNSTYEDVTEIGREHDPLLKAIEQGNVEQAKTLLQEHIMMGIEPLLIRLKQKQQSE